MLKFKSLSFQKWRYVLWFKLNFQHLSVFSFVKLWRELRTRRVFDRCEIGGTSIRYLKLIGSFTHSNGMLIMLNRVFILLLKFGDASRSSAVLSLFHPAQIRS